MAEAQAFDDATSTGRDSESASSGSGAAPSLDGQPIEELPPLVEFFGFDEPAAEAEPPPPPPLAPVEPPPAAVAEASSASPIARQRPQRRHFLAPIDDGAAVPSAPPPMLAERPPQTREFRPRPPARLLQTASEPAMVVARREPAAYPPTEFAPAAARPARRWPRYIAVTGGVVLALGLAVVVEVGIDPDWLHWMRLMATEQVARLTTKVMPGQPPMDPAQRLVYYKGRAATGDAGAQFTLAVIYARGEGVTQDNTAAAKWFRDAAEHGLARAQYDLGVLYEHGRGVPLDYDEAVRWYRKAAEGNYALAQYNLAVAYTKGEGVARDAAQAMTWYHRAATQGVVAAMVNLAILYERGEGVDASQVDAYAWYRAAARRGSQPAAQRADELLRAFAPADQTQAESKTAQVAASIRDAIGENSRQTAGTTPTAGGTKAPGPVFKSGIAGDQGGAPGASDTGAENP